MVEAAANDAPGMTLNVKAGDYGNIHQLNMITSGTIDNPIKWVGYETAPGDITSNYFDYGITMDFIPFPESDYRMDGCDWNGTVNEVKDSSTNSYDGTAKNGAITESFLDAEGGICHVGKFNGNNYLDFGDVLDAGSDDWSISIWVKWDGSTGENIIYNKENLHPAVQGRCV